MPISNRFGLPLHADRLDPQPELESAAARIDLIIAVFALGVILGSLL